MPKFTLFQTRLPATTPEEALAITAFWRDAGPKMWFAKDPEFEELFHIRFLATYEAAAAGELSDWNDTPEGALALTIILDQFPRNRCRGATCVRPSGLLLRQLESCVHS